MDQEQKILQVLRDVAVELQKAINKYPPMNSPHEGWAVIKEEHDELWLEIIAQNDARSEAALYAEAMQVAAMGLRFALDICLGGRYQR